MEDRPSPRQVAERLATFYEVFFGGKLRGRYRFSMKQMRALTGRKRVPAKLIRNIAEEVYELGYVLIDLETYFVVLAQATFRSYRRVSDGRLSAKSFAAGQSPMDNHTIVGTDL
jgi:hypothetical protein